MVKSMFICENCKSTFKIKEKIQGGIEEQKRALSKLDVEDKKQLDEAYAYLGSVQDKYFQEIGEDALDEKCGNCRKFVPRKNGMIIKDWHGFLDDIDTSLNETRKASKDIKAKTGHNIMPASKYLALKIALKAVKYV